MTERERRGEREREREKKNTSLLKHRSFTHLLTATVPQT